MKIYHGSDVPVPEPKILLPSRLLDFGEGFYTTSSYEQARRWAERVMLRQKSKNQIINVYDFEMSKASKDLDIIQFSSPNHDWLKFVTSCRIGIDTGRIYDIAIGPVANDNVYATIQLYESGLLSETEAIMRLRVEEIYDQILFHTDKALKYCSYNSYEQVKVEQNG